MKRIQVYVDDDTHAKVEELAGLSRQSISSYIGDVIIDWIEERDYKEKSEAADGQEAQ